MRQILTGMPRDRQLTGDVRIRPVVGCELRFPNRRAVTAWLPTRIIEVEDTRGVAEISSDCFELHHQSVSLGLLDVEPMTVVDVIELISTEQQVRTFAGVSV